MSVGTTGERQAAGAAGERYVDDDTGYGWVVFAGVLLLVVGTLNSIYGIAAIDDSKFFVNGSKYVFSDLNTWGWIVLCLGVAQLLVGFGVFAKNQFARWVGVGVLAMNAVAQMLFLPGAPFLAVSILAMDILAIYGLTAYGGKIGRTA
ncbi:MAG TPA: hypothetical protein VGF21_03615 [Thermoleophilaceae bacterium]|jgi:hypothetical protein